MKKKLFIGPKLRSLRTARGWNLSRCATELGVSISYLSQMEGNQRPVPPRILLAISDAFGVATSALDIDDDQRAVADLREAILDASPGDPGLPLSELRQAATHAPGLVRRYLEIHRAYRRLSDRLNATDEVISLDETAHASSQLPYEEVRDFFQFTDNYIHSLDTAAEDLAEKVAHFGAGERAFEAYLAQRFGVSVTRDAPAGLLRRYNRQTQTVSVNAANSPPSRSFQLAFQIVDLTLSDAIEEALLRAELRSPQAMDVCRVGLGNYAAGALVMPYRRFLAEAQAAHHDVEKLAVGFDASLEQVCHRLSTLQRPGERGLPFYFVRTDYAGNITKRHSATRFRFARFGGSCPLWNIHEAAGSPDRFIVQLAEMPDGVRYLCVARSVTKPSGSFSVPDRRYVLGFGCEAVYAGSLVYGDGLDIHGPAARIGVSCRICERDDCTQRAFPPVDRPLTVPQDERGVVPFKV